MLTINVAQSVNQAISKSDPAAPSCGNSLKSISWRENVLRRRRKGGGSGVAARSSWFHHLITIIIRNIFFTFHIFSSTTFPIFDPGFNWHHCVFRSRHYQTSIIKVYLDWVIEIALIEMQINCALLHQSRLSVRSCTRCWRLDAFIHTPSSSPSPGLPDLETAFLHCQLLSGIVRVSSFSTTIHLLSSHFSYSYHCSYL